MTTKWKDGRLVRMIADLPWSQCALFSSWTQYWFVRIIDNIL